MARRIGIYSGTFDPVHTGHVAFALAAREACSLDEVIFLPEAEPRKKAIVTEMVHRMALIEKVTQTISELRVVELSSRQFTPESTLRELRHLLGDAELTLLIGSDVVSHLLDWPNITMLLSEVSLAIGMRAGDSEQRIREMLQLSDIPLSPTFVHTPLSHAASSLVREGDTTHLAPRAAKYIGTHELYPRLSRRLKNASLR